MRHFSPQQLIRVHEYSFGVGVERRSLPDGSWSYSGGYSSKETHKLWGLLACAAVMEPCNPSDRKHGLQEQFKVDGRGPVCFRFWAASYGLPESARNHFLADARSSRGQADAEWQTQIGMGCLSEKEGVSLQQEATIRIGG